MRETHPRFVPASIQRLRCTMAAQGMRVKPWAGVEDTLDAFHDLLAERRRDDAFWQSLERLAAGLTRDFQTRMKAGRSGVIDNEILGDDRVSGLLAEIRRRVEKGRGERGRFAGLARRLSVGAAGLALILGGAITAGCYKSTDLRGDVQDARDGAGEADPALDPTPDYYPDPDVPLPDFPPDPPPDPPCDPTGRTLDEIIVDCVPTPDMQDYYRQCIDAMHASWRTGLAELFACESCVQVREQLMYCLDWRCWNVDPDQVFDMEDFLDNCGIPVYLGVRFSEESSG